MTTNRLAKSEAPKISRTPREAADFGNDYLKSIGRSDCRWVVRDGKLKMEFVHPLRQPRKHIADRDRRNFTTSDWAELNEHLERMGSPVRYSSEGKRV
jgi:hypothetical protein